MEQLTQAPEQPRDPEEPTEEVYLLRQRRTLLQSQLELARSQLQSMGGGKSSREFYARVFVPLQDQLEATARKHDAAVAATQPSRRNLATPATTQHSRRFWARPFQWTKVTA